MESINQENAFEVKIRDGEIECMIIRGSKPEIYAFLMMVTLKLCEMDAISLERFIEILERWEKDNGCKCENQCS